MGRGRLAIAVDGGALGVGWSGIRSLILGRKGVANVESGRFGEVGGVRLALLVVGSMAAAGEKEQITIYRDTFGTPHIYASTAEGACFGHGYAQASDRLEELLKQYMRATGTMSEAFGPEFFRDDYRQRIWQHAAISKAKYHEIGGKSRALIEAFQAGVKQYMKEHPSEVPAWAPQIEPWMCVALGRYIIWGWPEGEAADDLERIGLEGRPDRVSRLERMAGGPVAHGATTRRLRWSIRI